MSVRKSPKVRHDTHKLCALAAERLKAVGFERACVSMKTEATYFRLPGRHGLLRVAAHGSKNTLVGLDYVAARLTFHGNQFDGHSILVCSPEKIDTMIWIAVGQYIMRSAQPMPSEYRGKRGTWEHGCEFIEGYFSDRCAAGDRLDPNTGEIINIYSAEPQKTER